MSLVRSITWLVISWTGWAVVAAVLVASGDPGTPIAFVAFSALWVSAVLLALVSSSACRDHAKQWPSSLKQRVYSPVAQKPTGTTQYSHNLGNTVITLVITTAVLPALCWHSWYPERNRHVIILERDTVAYFPSFTLFQRADWTSQAILGVSATPKCFLGWHDETAADCSIARDGLIFPCNCAGNWADSIRDFEWQNTSYRALTFTSSENTVSLSPTFRMIAQAFFTYDSSKSLADSSVILSPSLFIAVHDPTPSLEEALKNGYTRMVLINANGVTAINLGLDYREARGRTPAYDYQLTISPIPSNTLECDVSAPGGASGSCFLSLFLQFPSFERQVSRQDIAMKWQDAASLAGSWFALFQLAGWIASGSAWHT
ncbi:hypothetical protein QBC46DRAFT_314542 [Diplogelasinospora grovesii]|uniref:Uncharacterized protein n=1 Tax=Diplogelasinospora grovesii TaxID=303347 RepID=A0AAN6N855_9PEZI|nr:hypothetical protein QBC46DRAFT_314542 [Diplogelasinospora grovesii]